LMAGRPAGLWRSGRGIWSAFTASLLCVGLIASHSRSGVVGAVVASAVLLVIERDSVRRLGARWIVLACLVLAMLIALSARSPYQRMASLLDPDSYQERLEIWGATLRAWSSHWFLGSGLGSFTFAVAPEVRTDYGVVFARAENEYLDVLLEGGLVGLAILLAGLLALARRGSRALRAAPSPQDRAAVAGALFGLVALAVQSAGDFSPHILGVAITAVILAAHIGALGAPAGSLVCRRRRSKGVGASRTLQAVAIAALCLALLPCDLDRARAEAQLAGIGLPPPGSSMPEMTPVNLSMEDLQRRRAALEAALDDRPDWAEGHFRLGLTLVALYEQTAADWVATQVDGPAMIASIADALWLHEVAQSAKAEEIAEQEPVSLYLAPAARCFLEARRCAPAFAAAHARLGSLEYLLVGRDPPPAHARRALEYAGSDRITLWLAARVAIQSGHAELAACCWRRCLLARPWEWEETADMVAASLPAEQVLDQVLPPGGWWPVAFADRAYAKSEDRDDRAKFLRAALERLQGDRSLSAAERLHLEARARSGLGQHDLAGPLYDDALKREPLRGEWREEFVAWLIDRGDFAAAHRHAVLGTRLNPERPALRRALEQSVEALARAGRRP
jgi:tetratricopeptide (TPR) repeat protein